MHPAFRAWRAFASCGHRGWGGCGPGSQAWEGSAEEEFGGGFGGGAGLGVRRPLRFLVHRLGLDERQTVELARILNELKTERAQAEVDRQRTLAAFADAVSADTFDATKAAEGGDLRLKTADRVRAAVLKALQEFHALLNAEQRSRLAYLIRTGTISL